MSSDVVLLVPFQPSQGTFIDKHVRRTALPGVNIPIMRARSAFEAHLGQHIAPSTPGWSSGANRVGATKHRSAAAVVLATHLEREGLSWHVIDPGAQSLSYWRKRLAELRASPPISLAICTTFIVSGGWLHQLCGLVRRALPTTQILLGGYYYGTSTKDFLDSDADVFCVGEGEVRFPAIVRALRDNRRDELKRIPGLYVREPDGGLVYTGRAEPIELQTLQMPDWRLAERCDPPVRISEDSLVYVVETQRGCIFKCEYCTYRTLSELNIMTPERAVDVIMNIVPKGAAKGSHIDIVDATGTYPHPRWERICELLIERGGSPYPITAYARVSDISESTAELMSRAGVCRVLIGQESGDQDMLNRMRKGTNVRQVAPAIAALGRHGIDPILSFIHGFPGESRQSLEATRQLIATINDGAGGAACALYRIEPFSVYDFATVSRAPEMKEADHHYLGYASNGVLSIDEIMKETLATIIEVSRVPTAPACESLFDWMRFPTGEFKGRLSGATRQETFRWVKAFERGVTIFLERDLWNVEPDEDELRGVCHVLAGSLPSAWLGTVRTRIRSRLVRTVLGRLGSECRAENEAGEGALTRLALSWMAVTATGNVRALLTPSDFDGRVAGRDVRQTQTLASDLVQVALRHRKEAASVIRAASEVSRRDDHPPEEKTS